MALKSSTPPSRWDGMACTNCRRLLMVSNVPPHGRVVRTPRGGRSYNYLPIPGIGCEHLNALRHSRPCFCLLPPVAFARCSWQSTYDIWQEAISFCKPGRQYKGIGGVIQDLVEAKGYSTVENFCECFCPCRRLGRTGK